MSPLPKIKDVSNMKATRLNHHRVFLTAVLAGILIIAGCAGRSGVVSLANEDRAMIKQTSLTLEQRTFNVSEAKLIKALVNALSSKSLIVQTLEKDAGFMMAEGPEILDYNTLLSVKNERNARWNAKQGGLGMAGYALPDVILKVTVNFYSKGVDKTLVKMKINSVVQTCMHPEFGEIVKLPIGTPKMPAECPPSPTMVSLWYQQLWDEIEKSIFMQRETILK